MYKELNSSPKKDDFYMPAEFAPHMGTFMIFPWRPGSWKNGAKLAGEIFAGIANEIAKHEKMYMFARPEDIERARKLLSNQVELIPFDNDDAWARDTGATFVINNEELRGINWKFNAWGGEFNGLYADWSKDDLVAKKLCETIDVPVYDFGDFVLEGGSIHSDGEGTILTTEECLLSGGRNPHMTKEEIAEKLKETLGAEKVIWLPLGIYNDETDGHVDNMCAFTAPAEVILAWTDDINDPQYERSIAAYEILSKEKDAQGRSFVIHKLPIPNKPICITEEDLVGYEFEDGEDEREVGERLAASYVNFYIANDIVLVPQFDDENDKLACDIIEKCFPDRKVIPVLAREILTGGGNIHCITQQIPKA